MPDLTSDTVTGLWSHLSGVYGTTVVPKDSAPEMRWIAKFLRMDDFMTGFTTTIGKRIYVPFTVGVPVGGWSLFGQLAVAVHEHQHVVQLNRDGFRFLSSYLLSPTARMRYEVEAYISSMEMEGWYRGTVDPARPLDSLKSYKVSASDLDAARDKLETAAEAIRGGAILNEATRVALDWLSLQAPPRV